VLPTRGEAHPGVCAQHRNIDIYKIYIVNLPKIKFLALLSTLISSYNGKFRQSKTLNQVAPLMYISLNIMAPLFFPVRRAIVQVSSSSDEVHRRKQGVLNLLQVVKPRPDFSIHFLRLILECPMTCFR
jgi:hypothetical protein